LAGPRCCRTAASWVALGNIFIRVAETLLNGWELAAGMLPPTASGVLVAAAGVDIALIVMFALALRRA